MKLEQLRPNLGDLPEAEAFRLFESYCLVRAQDLESLTVTPKEVGKGKKTVRKKTKKDEVTVSQADLAMLKKLGLI